MAQARIRVQSPQEIEIDWQTVSKQFHLSLEQLKATERTSTAVSHPGHSLERFAESLRLRLHPCLIRPAPISSPRRGMHNGYDLDA